MLKNKYWIWHTEKNSLKREKCFFRKKFNLDTIPASFWINVSADSRYILFVNGKRVAVGPLKGDRYSYYYERIDIQPYLYKGENLIAATVLRFPYCLEESMEGYTGPSSIVSSSHAGFMLFAEDEAIELQTNRSWKVKIDYAFKSVCSNPPRQVGEFEEVDGSKCETGWNTIQYDDSEWSDSVQLIPIENHTVYGCLYNWQLKERTIPLLYEKLVKPVAVAKGSGGIQWDNLLQNKPVVLPPDSTYFVELDMGELTTAYVGLQIDTKSGNDIEIVYSECYYQQNEQGDYVKGIRDDSNNGMLLGDKDVYFTGDGYQEYEPFWFRTFRFIRVGFKVSKAPLKITGLYFRETGYPLDIQSSLDCRDESLRKCYDISVRTLKRCMHETYEDCPYYEQVQYVMDTAIQMKLTYIMSSDDRLARKAIYDFHSTQRPDGMICCGAPVYYEQIIPGFSLFWIQMIYDHYFYYADKKLLEFYMPTAERILYYFHLKIDESTGICKDIGYWQFVDWTDKWNDHYGAPCGKDDAFNYIYNMMYCCYLLKAAYLFEQLQKYSTAQMLMERYTALKEAIIKYAWNLKSRYFLHNSTDKTFSQHAQVWAVLAEIIKGEEAVELMERCISDNELIQCSYSMSYFLFRAIEKAGIYEKSFDLWDKWTSLFRYNITTWPEDDINQRSDCHAWSATPIHEILTCILGVKPLKPGFDGVLIRPQIHFISEISGTVSTPKGSVFVHMKTEKVQVKTQIYLHIKVPEGLKTIVRMPDGKDFTIEDRSEAEINYTVDEIIKVNMNPETIHILQTV